MVGGEGGSGPWARTLLRTFEHICTTLEHIRTLPPCPAPQCVQSCANKFMKHSARVGIRFGELSSEAESQMQAMMQQQQGGK